MTTSPVMSITDELLADEIHQMAFEEGQPADNGDGYLFTAEEFDLFVERLLARNSAAMTAHIRSLTERLEKTEKALKRIAMRAETFVIDDTPMKPSSMMVILGIACSALGDAAIAQEGAEHE